MSDLEPIRFPHVADIPPEMLDRLLMANYQLYLHTSNGRLLIVTAGLQQHSLDEAHQWWMSIPKWQHMTVGVQGSLKARLQDQQMIGRKRGPGERTNVPLPDWYDLTHLIYEHGRELGFDPSTPIFQLFPSPDMEYINYAESLHVRQPK